MQACPDNGVTSVYFATPTVHHNPLSAAVLDLDGTLVHTLGDFHAALNLMLDELRLPAAPVDGADRRQE